VFSTNWKYVSKLRNAISYFKTPSIRAHNVKLHILRCIFALSLFNSSTYSSIRSQSNIIKEQAYRDFYL